MQDTTRWNHGLSARGDGKNIIGHAGALLLHACADKTGLTNALDHALPSSAVNGWRNRASALITLANATACGATSLLEAERLHARVHALRLADDVIAGQDLIVLAFRELDSAVRLLRESTHTEAVGRSLQTAVGELAQIARWIASDAGQHDKAERTYRLGLSAAREAGDGTLAGQLSGCLAYQWSNIGRLSDGVLLAEAALAEAGTQAPPRARVLFWDRVAWARTKAGDASATMFALGEAEEALSQHAEEDEPTWLYWVDAGELQVMEARAYTELRHPLRAVPLLNDVLSHYDATHTRAMARYLSWLAAAYTDANEPEQAAHVARRMLEMSEDLGSDRTSERAQVVRASLRPFRDVPEVREVLNAA